MPPRAEPTIRPISEGPTLVGPCQFPHLLLRPAQCAGASFIRRVERAQDFSHAEMEKGREDINRVEHKNHKDPWGSEDGMVMDFM